MTEREATGEEARPPASPPAAVQSNPPRAAGPRERVSSSSQSRTPHDTSRSNSPPSAPVDSPVPTIFGRYSIERELGRGAMGVVYLAEDTQLHRKVALKIPRQSSLQDPDALERFYREARTTATLRHSNICAIYDVGAIDGVHFLAMAYIPGKPVSRFINKEKLPATRQVALLIRKIALALDEAHRQGVVHRDLKPSNVMLDDRGEPIVMDFGLARQMNTVENARLTQSGAILGTPAYMAPEQVRGEIDQIGPRSDIYALGVMLYQFLTGELPFSGPVMMVFAQIVTQTPQRPSELRPDVDPELEAICLKMMAKDIAERYAGMKDVAGALTRYLKSASPSSVVSRADTAPRADFSEPGPSLDSLSAALRGQPVPASAQVRDDDNGAVSVMVRSWSQFRKKSWFWPAAGGLGAVVATLAIAFFFVRPDPASIETRPDAGTARDPAEKSAVSGNTATAGAGEAMAPPAINPAFPVGATYRGMWKNFSPLQFESDAETVVSFRAIERDGDSFVSELAMQHRGAVWIIKGTIASTEDGEWSLTSNDVDLVDGVHPNEVGTTFVAELVSAAEGQPETIRGRADYATGEHSEFEVRRIESSPAEDSPSKDEIDRERYSIMGGSWRVEGDELVQSDAGRTFSYLMFGDRAWTDYDFSVEVMRVEGLYSVALLCRNDGPAFYLCAVGHGRGALAEVHTADRDENGQIRWWQVTHAEYPLQNHQWYPLRVRVRGSHIECEFFNGFDWQTLMEFSDDRFPRGSVGLRTVQGAFRFKNIRVTDPEGKVLWEGMPALGGQ